MASTINASTSAGIVQTADTSGVLQLQTANTTALTVDASQNVGIGTASPTSKLEVNGNLLLQNATRLSFKNTDGTIATVLQYFSDNNTYLDAPNGNSIAGGGNMIFRPNGTERMRIDSSGNVGIGIASPGVRLAVSDASNANNGTIRLGSTGNGVYGEISNKASSTGRLTLNSVGGGAAADGIEFQIEGSNKAMIDSSGNVGIGLTPSGSYKCEVSGGLGLTYAGGDNYVYFNSTGAYVGRKGSTGDIWLNNPGGQNTIFGVGGSEKARFDSSGNFLVNTTTLDGRITVAENLTSQNGISIKNTVAQTGTQWFAVFRNSSGVNAGSIAHTGTTTVAYNTSSDARLKENIIEAPTALPVVENINVRSYDWKEDKRHVDFGFIAQELYSYFPEAVSAGNDSQELEDGKGVWQVDYARITPLLLKAIQELNAKVTALEAQLGAK